MFEKIKGYFSNDKKNIETYHNEEHLKKVELWRSLYKGYCSKIHEIKYRANNNQKTRNMKSLNMAKIISKYLSTLILNEKFELNFDKDNTWDIISDTLKHNKFRNNFQENIEKSFALGGVAAECFYNADTNKIEINYIHEPNFIPLKWTSGKKITEAMLIVETVEDAGKIHSLVRVHHFPNSIYTITHELYVKYPGEKGLGKKEPLKSRYPDLPENLFFNNIQEPFFAYCKPATANNFDLDSPLGISIYANSIDTLTALDKAYDSLDRELELGKRRIIVPASFIKVDETHEAYFDTEDEIYQGMNVGNFDDWKISDMAPVLRIDEHVTAINTNLQLLSLQIGLSPGTFVYDARTGLKTATEVISENSETFKTKKSHENSIDHFIREIIDIIFRLGKEVSLFNEIPKYELEINYDDSIIEDHNTTINQQITLVGQGLQSKVDAMMIIYKITQTEAEEKLKAINDEKDIVSPDVTDILG